MADLAICIITVALAVLTMVIIRTCFVSDNSKRVKLRRDTDGTRRKATVKSAADTSHGQKLAWRNTGKQHRPEVEVQKISVFQYAASEEESIEEFSRLEKSSTDRDLSGIRAESPSPRRPARRQTRRHRQQARRQRGSEGNTAVALWKKPGWINFQGPLARTSDDFIYLKIRNELMYNRDNHPSSNIHVYLDNKFELSRKDDMAVQSLIQGTYSAQHMTDDLQQALTRLKRLQRDIPTYNLKYPYIAESQVHVHKYVHYMRKGKPGKAHSAAQAAVSCIQHHSPSPWTANVCDLQGNMFDRLAHVSPGHRSKYQDLALRFFTNAREHCLYQSCQEEEDLFSPLYYILQTLFIKLDMPTLNTITDFADTDIVYQRLSQCVVPQCQVNEAQIMVASLTSHIAITSLIDESRVVINERVLICTIFVYIRLAQLAFQDKAHHLALSFIKTAEDLRDVWSDHASRKNALFNRFPHLASDIEKVLKKQFDRLIVTCPPAPQSEPLSDSISSEPSDAPPSGLKQLTDESRRAEKRARRDAHQFSHSSGDIYTNTDADVPSEVN